MERKGRNQAESDVDLFDSVNIYKSQVPGGSDSAGFYYKIYMDCRKPKIKRQYHRVQKCPKMYSF